jgi:outer membrane protein assembly factor BamB
MKRKYIFIILVVLFLTISMSACTGRSSMTASGWAGIITDEDTAYVAFNTHVVAINLTNGTERWRYPAEADPKITFYAAPAFTEDGRLIVGGYDNVIYSINTANGQGTPLFEGAEGRFVGGPLVIMDQVYAPSADHNLYAIDLNGRLLWDFETDEPLWARPATDPDCNCIYITSMDHKVYAINSQSGNLIWSTEDLGGAIVGTPVISDDMVLYVGTFANEMVALDAKTGSVLWRFPTQDWVWEGPGLDADTLYFGDLSGTLYAVGRQDGASKWQIQPDADSSIVGTPLVTEDGIYFTTEAGSMVSVNSNGAIRWNQPFEDTSFHTGPVQVGEILLIATSNPEKLLIAVDPNGVQKWSFGLDN